MTWTIFGDSFSIQITSFHLKKVKIFKLHLGGKDKQNLIPWRQVERLNSKSHTDLIHQAMRYPFVCDL